MRGAPWSILDCDPTTDPIEIRRAYARRLKVVHPEDDPEGFQALRKAHDDALRLAQSDQRGVSLQCREAPADKPSEPDQAAPAEPSQEVGADRSDEETHRLLCAALSAAVYHPEADDEAAVDALLAVLRSPAMGSLQTFGSTEEWLFHLLENGPDIVGALVEPAVGFFGWDTHHLKSRRLGARARHLQQVWLGAQSPKAWFRSLSAPGSRNKAAWLSLTRPPTLWARLRDRLVYGRPAAVRDLLSRIRARYPKGEDQLDADAVAAWEDYLSRPRLSEPFLWFAAIGPLLLCTLIAYGGEEDLAMVVSSWTVPLAMLIVGRLAWLYCISWPLHRHRLRRRESDPDRTRAALLRAERPGSPDHRAYTALKTRGSRLSRIRDRLTPGLAGQTRRLLREARVHHPAWLLGLDPAAVERWDRLHSRPRIGLETPLIMAALTILLLPGLAIAFVEQRLDLILVLPLLAGLVVALRVGIIFAIEWPLRLLWRALPVGRRTPALAVTE